MRNYIHVLLFGMLVMMTNFSYASMEYEPGQNGIISEKKLGQQRSCFREIKEQGCGHPRENQIFFKACLEENVDQLSSNCRAFFMKLYGKRNQSEN